MIILTKPFNNTIKLKRNLLKYIIRLCVILCLSALIKGFDQTFNGFFDMSSRSWFFSLSFLFYWMISWELGSFILYKSEAILIQRVKSSTMLFILTIMISIFSVSISLLFNLFYRWWDIWLFAMKGNWKMVPFPHPDLIYPLFILIMLVYFSDRINQFNIQLKNAELYSSRLEQENIRARYNALKNQVDPHFFFNSLSVLSSMVYADPDLSSKYIHNLSKLYRYILERKENSIVPLSKELEILDAYIFLMKIRHHEGLFFKINIDTDRSEKIGLHQNSLQLLVENSIKHNVFTCTEPLSIEIYEESDFVCVKNQLRKRKLLGNTTGIGLENIKSRYKLYDNKLVQIEDKDGYFTVKLPKLKIPGNEDFNN